MISLTQWEFFTLYDYIRSNYGINLEKKQYLVESRLESEFRRWDVTRFSEYWRRLRADRTGAMVLSLLDCLTTQYTFFCREEKHFRFLREKLVSSFDHNIYLWCAGCATGQEPYTLAMLLAECRALGALKFDYHIVATDVSKEAIRVAQTGIYRSTEYERLPKLWQTNYCLRQKDGSFIVSTPVRDTIRFLQQNLMDAMPSVCEYDLILCRNVLIYFQEKEREIVVKNLYHALRPGGYLFIGHTESLLGCTAAFEYIRPAVYRKPLEEANATN